MKSKNALTELLFESVAFMQALSDSEKEQIVNSVIFKHINNHEILYIEGDTCIYNAFVLQGSVKVFKEAENGREIILYHITTGESCILTMSCIIGKRKFPAISAAESDVVVALFPAEFFLEMMDKSREWRGFVFRLLTERLASVISIVEEIAFKKVDRRLIEFIMEKTVREGKEIIITHQEIAAEVGSSREVISRLLKDLENTGAIALGRGKIIVNNLLKLQ